MRMRQSLLGCLFVLLNIVAPRPALSAGGPVGLGIIVGGPTGISGKYVLSPTNAVAGAVAWHFHNGLQVQADYLWIDPQFIKTSANPISGYVGVGGRLRTWSGSWCGNFNHCEDSHGVGLGVRIPLGFEYSFQPQPFDLFLELVPTLDLIPGTDLDLDIALGGRIFF